VQDLVTEIELPHGAVNVLIRTQASMLQIHLLERGARRPEKTNGCQRPRHTATMPVGNPNHEGTRADRELVVNCIPFPAL
jgi:hypothetical protein